MKAVDSMWNVRTARGSLPDRTFPLPSEVYWESGWKSCRVLFSTVWKQLKSESGGLVRLLLGRAPGSHLFWCWMRRITFGQNQPWRRTWQPTPVFLLREPQGWGSLAGCRLWGPTESDLLKWLSSSHEVVFLNPFALNMAALRNHSFL